MVFIRCAISLKSTHEQNGQSSITFYLQLTCKVFYMWHKLLNDPFIEELSLFAIVVNEKKQRWQFRQVNEFLRKNLNSLEKVQSETLDTKDNAFFARRPERKEMTQNEIYFFSYLLNEPSRGIMKIQKKEANPPHNFH